MQVALGSLGTAGNQGEGTWLEGEQVLACAYPRHESALKWLAQRGISVLVNLHERAHDPSLLASHGFTEVHLPVRDFTPPSPEQLEQGVEAIVQGLAAGKRVAVHCGAGLGRTGTLLACYLVHKGLQAEEAIGQIRAARPGSVETPSQEAAVRAYMERHNANRGAT
jgi:atypical dual specificity phosphatase